jgi:hypothetical protein
VTATLGQPVWHETDETTGSLLDLIADDGSLLHEREWNTYLAALRDAATPDGVVRPNALRPLVTGRIKPCRLGPFARRAVLEGVMVPDGWQVTEGSGSGNDGKPARCYRLTDSPAAPPPSG